MAQPVKAFINDAYQLISASSPTVPLHGDDTEKGIQFLNELVDFYSASGLLTPIARQVSTNITNGTRFVSYGPPGLIPPADVQEGRLANLLNAWMLLDGVTYPLIDLSRNEFKASFKYDPQLGLPRYAIVENQLERTTIQLFPGASQFFELNVFGKFQLPNVTQNDTMAQFPTYMIRFLRLAVAKDISIYKGRASAWTPLLEEMYMNALKDIEGASSFNLEIVADIDSSLNGSWRVKAGI